MKVSKRAEKHTSRTWASKKYSPVKLENMTNPHIQKVGIHKFENGEEAAIFDVADYRALNQIIGYAKFINTDYGDVFYRGEAHLHSTLLPSISRKASSWKYEEQLSNVIGSAIKDEKFSKFAKLRGFKGKNNTSLVAEAALQHYGYSTHFIDVVDNHWVALWFGLNSFRTMKNLKEYCFYERRVINPVEIIDPSPLLKNDIYQYLILIAVDNNMAPIERGIYFGNDVITIDLRSSLPSVFLRPHAQHGLVIRRNTHTPGESYDLSKNVIAIIRLRIDRVANWIGSGNLLSNENLFPAPAYDHGYEVLLQRNDLFVNKYHSIARYI